MKREDWEWLGRNIAAVNTTFDIDLSLGTQAARERAERCIDIFDSEEAFNEEFHGVYLRDDCAFEIQSSEGYAAYIDGKYISFLEINY